VHEGHHPGAVGADRAAPGLRRPPVHLAADRNPPIAEGTPRATTSITGRTAGRRGSTTSRCSVAGITGRSTRRATRSCGTPTARCASARRAAGPFPTSRSRTRCRVTPCRPTWQRIGREVFRSTRRRGSRIGAASARTSAGRSTSCIPQPSRPHPDRMGSGTPRSIARSWRVGSSAGSWCSSAPRGRTARARARRGARRGSRDARWPGSPRPARPRPGCGAACDGRSPPW
jgi:hypothetical protein